MYISAQALNALQAVVGASNVQTDDVSLLLHAYDCSLSRMRPDAVVHIPSAAQVAPVVQILHRFGLPFVARAAATNHAGSCSTPQGGVVLNLTRLNRILQINTQEGYAIAEPGVVTQQLQQALQPLGFFYAPDPASQRVCTLGGNIAQNASGARCLKYGGTLDHVLEVQCVLPDGQTVTLSRQDPGPDWVGVLTGSEGTLGIITQLKVKILPLAKHLKTFLATFSSLEDSVQTVTDLAARGVIPRCVEAMDRLTTQAVEEFSHAGYPTRAEALLILELDGTPKQIKQDETVLAEICRQNHVQQFIHAQTEKARQKLWQGRQAAYAAMARLAPNVLVCDGTVPRSELPATLRRVRRILTEQNVRASLLFHAGDGNFHPQIILDERNRQVTQHAGRVVKQILQACVDAGGTISGEHGVGVEKRSVMAYQYDSATLGTFERLKRALDPDNLANPYKIIPLDFAEKAATPPANRPEIAHLAAQLQQAAGQHQTVAITGNRTAYSPSGPTCSTATLDRVLDIDLANYTATVQAGVTLTRLNQALRERGAYSVLPNGPGTLGGAFSSGRFPDFYAHVTGVSALLPDGSLVRYGGKLTKNAAGYNLIRLFAGAQGSLGLVTELTFKIYATRPAVLAPLPFRPLVENILWQRVKNALDPQHIFSSPQEQTP